MTVPSTINLTTTVEAVEPTEVAHRLQIVDSDGVELEVVLTGAQLMMLVYQAAAALWSYHRLVPRE